MILVKYDEKGTYCDQFVFGSEFSRVYLTENLQVVAI